MHGKSVDVYIIVELIGIVSVIFLVGGNIPQLIKTLKDKDVSSFSFWFLFCWGIGCILNFIYVVLKSLGWMLYSLNVLNFLFPLTLMILFFKYRKK